MVAGSNPVFRSTFVVVWVTQSISVWGSSLTFFAINIWLTVTLYPLPEQKPQLAGALAAVNLTFTLCTLLAYPLAGAWADRHDRKLTMAGSDLISGGLSLALGLLVVTGELRLWIMVILLGISAVVATFHQASFEASYAMLVPTPQLPRANGMMAMSWSLASILAPGMAAGIIAVPALLRQAGSSGALGHTLGNLPDGTALAMAIDALTFLLAAIALFFLHVPSPRPEVTTSGGRPRSMWADAGAGVTYIWRRRPLFWLLWIFAMANMVYASLGILTPLLVKFNLAADWTGRGFTLPSALALLNTVGGIGGVVGGLFMSAWGGVKRRRVYMVVSCVILNGLALIACGLSSWLYLAAGAILFFNLVLPLVTSHSQAIWQTQVPREMQGRVFAIRRMLAQGLSPLSVMIVGVISGLWNPGLVLAGMGAILVLFFGAQLFNPMLLRVEDKEYLDGLEATEGTMEKVVVKSKP